MNTIVSRPSSLFTPTTGCTTTAPNAAHEHLDHDDYNAWSDEHDTPPTDAELEAMFRTCVPQPAVTVPAVRVNTAPRGRFVAERRDGARWRKVGTFRSEAEAWRAVGAA